MSSGTPTATKPAVSAASVTPTPPGTGMSPAKRATALVDDDHVDEVDLLAEGAQHGPDREREEELGGQVEAQQPHDGAGRVQHGEGVLELPDDLDHPPSEGSDHHDGDDAITSRPTTMTATSATVAGSTSNDDSPPKPRVPSPSSRKLTQEGDLGREAEDGVEGAGGHGARRGGARALEEPDAGRDARGGRRHSQVDEAGREHELGHPQQRDRRPATRSGATRPAPPRHLAEHQRRQEDREAGRLMASTMVSQPMSAIWLMSV